MINFHIYLYFVNNFKAFREVHRDVTLSFDFATADSLRTALSFGCRTLHFSGHGHPQFLNFEDGRSGLHLLTLDALRRLLRAGGLKLDFVFVSACFSRPTGEAFVEAGVPHVVCCKVDAMVSTLPGLLSCICYAMLCSVMLCYVMLCYVLF